MYDRDAADRIAVIAARYVQAQVDLGHAMELANQSAIRLHQQTITSILTQEDLKELCTALAALMVSVVHADLPGGTGEERLRAFLDIVISACEME